MTLNRITTTATTSRIWIKPPAVYEVAIPSAHSTNRITHSVQSTLLAPFRVLLLVAIIRYAPPAVCSNLLTFADLTFRRSIFSYKCSVRLELGLKERFRTEHRSIMYRIAGSGPHIH